MWQFDFRKFKLHTSKETLNLINHFFNFCSSCFNRCCYFSLDVVKGSCYLFFHFIKLCNNLVLNFNCFCFDFIPIFIQKNTRCYQCCNSSYNRYYNPSNRIGQYSRVHSPLGYRLGSCCNCKSNKCCTQNAKNNSNCL